MRDRDLEDVMDALNAGEIPDWDWWYNLSPTVEFARISVVEAHLKTSNECLYSFFFIKDTRGVYVGIVLDMVYDLHVFIKPQHRKKGHLCNALNDVILPYLFQAGRKIQTVSFNEIEVADSWARRLGFRSTDKRFRFDAVRHAEKDLSVYATLSKIEPQPAALRQGSPAVRRTTCSMSQEDDELLR